MGRVVLELGRRAPPCDDRPCELARRLRRGGKVIDTPTPVAPQDWNWLLSTTAQSAAALVAIVGGFLVTRLVTLSADREALRRRAHEIQVRIDGLEQGIDERTERLRSSVSYTH